MAPDTMDQHTIFRILSQHRQIILITAAVIPVVTLLASFLHGVYDGRRGPWRHFYALVTHLTTLVVAAVVAQVVYHILLGGSLNDPVVPITPSLILFGSWLLTLGFVKRAVDFSMLRTIRSPLGLLLSWLLGWAAAGIVVFMDFWFIPGPESLSVLAALLVAFLLVRLVFRVLFASKDQR
jgi:hypothetical protein